MHRCRHHDIQPSPPNHHHQRMNSIGSAPLVLSSSMGDRNFFFSHPPAPFSSPSFGSHWPDGTNDDQRSLLMCTLLLCVVPSSGFFVSGCSSAMRRRDAKNSGVRMDSWRSEFWCPLSPASRQIQTTTLTCVLAFSSISSAIFRSYSKPDLDDGGGTTIVVQL